jgi:hypothetical protein
LKEFDLKGYPKTGQGQLTIKIGEMFPRPAIVGFGLTEYKKINECWQLVSWLRMRYAILLYIGHREAERAACRNLRPIPRLGFFEG